MNDTAPWPRPATAWYMVGILMLGYILSFIDRVILGLLVGPIRADLGISDTQMSLLYGFVFAIFYTVIGVPIAWAIDRYNRRNIIAASVALWSAMTAFCGLARNFTQLAFARIGVAIGEAALSPGAYSMAGDSFPEKRLGRALSVFMFGLPVGVGLALIIGGLVIQAVSGAPEYVLPLVGTVRAWQLVFFIVGVPGLALALLTLTVREPARRRRPGDSTRVSVPATLAYMARRWRVYSAMILGFAVLGMVMNVYQIWGVQHFVRLHGLTVPEAGLRLGIAIAVFGTAGILTGGWLTDRWRAAGATDAALRVGMTAAVALAPLAVWCMLTDSVVLASVLLVPIGFFTSFPFGAGATAVVVLTPPRMRAQVSAIYLLFVNLIGIGFAPFITAVLTDRLFHSDLAVGRSVALVTGIAAVAACLLFLWARPLFRAEVAALAGPAADGAERQGAAD